MNSIPGKGGPQRAAARGRLAAVIARHAQQAQGTFPLSPINRLFTNFAGTGGKVERLLRANGVDPGGNAAIGEEIDAAVLVTLLRRTMRLANDETWGLRPTPTKPGTFAQACRLATCAGTVEAGLRDAFRFYHGLADDFTLRLAREGTHTRISLHDAVPLHPGREVMHTLVLQTVRASIEFLSGRQSFVERIEFAYARPQADALDAIFGAPFLGNAAQTGMMVRNAVLARAIVAQPGQVRAFTASLLDTLAMVVQVQRGVADRAGSALRAQNGWFLGRVELAAALNMSAATFRRRLHREIGAGFQELKDRLRCAAALELMARDSLSLEQVAQALGFAELSSFHRAFKRWTGLGPSAYRAGHPGAERGRAESQT